MRLTCFYMGRAASRTVTEAELRDQWTLVEMGEDVDKIDGREFQDADGPKGFDKCPQDWKDGKATETGCGPWRGGLHADLIPICDDLLVRAGLPRLTVVMADGVPDLEATFDVEGGGVNYEQLYALDLAAWRLRPLRAQELRALGQDDDLGSEGLFDRGDGLHRPEITGPKVQ